jgi:prophage antirepressor-like protein
MLFKSVPEEWRGGNLISTLGGDQEMLCISEQGLYFFLARSDKPAALPFQKKIAGEVIPCLNARQILSEQLPFAWHVAQPQLYHPARLQRSLTPQN